MMVVRKNGGHVNKKLGILAVVALAVAGAVAITLMSRGDTSSPESAGTSHSTNDMSNMGSSNTDRNDGDTSVSATEVTISNYAYSPQNITVKVGDSVTWTNQDSVQHDVVSDDGVSNGPGSQLLSQGESYSFTFTKAGTYNYHCSPHPYMTGTVTVEE